jgi:uncharacterized protein
LLPLLVWGLACTVLLSCAPHAAARDGCARNPAQCTESNRSSSVLDAECDAGDASSCFELALRHADGDSVPQDDARAHRLLARACDIEYPTACALLGFRLTVGGDAGSGARHLERACAGGVISACGLLATQYYHGKGVVPDQRKARRLWRRACRRGDEGSCKSLADLAED